METNSFLYFGSTYLYGSTNDPRYASSFLRVFFSLAYFDNGGGSIRSMASSL